ncbi:SET domain-containing protein 9-like [Mya arenaria]|uniref:SET domain-containing protein 9-like n=1 Tax=Mya arenaria TaxID=6604 RepID=UPI0022E61D10|nr:SET domain-containing protein 9-like [Mya arenaria]XP_052776840.1 SET domain-containing protein 9-like [Mya arenaria]
MFQRILKRWSQYKYRFVPWIANNLNENHPRLVPSVLEDKVVSDDVIEHTLLTVFQKFNSTSSLHRTEQNVRNVDILFKELGYKTDRRKSCLSDGGRGVFVTDGTVKPGTLVSLYPGLVYQPWEPVFWVSLANPFLFRCADGVHIDGKDTGLSKMMYNSCARRDGVMGELMCDTSWLVEKPVNPLAVGQYVNNQTEEFPANVAYQEFDVPVSFPVHLRKYFPNTEARLQTDMDQQLGQMLLRLVVLVSLREVQAGEELFSTYYTIVSSNQ